MWDFVTSLNPAIDRAKSETWYPPEWSREDDPWPESGRGLFQEHGSGWAAFAVRLRERVAFVFERLFGTDRLHTSKDGFTLMRPPRTAAEVEGGDWSHFDQDGRAGNEGLKCVQGSVSLIDQDPGDGCFQCWPRSHKVVAAPWRCARARAPLNPWSPLAVVVVAMIRCTRK